MKLTELPIGSTGEVKMLRGSGALRQRLLDMGIGRGTRIRMVRTAPLKDPIQIFVKGVNLALRRAEADLVELKDEPKPGSAV